MRYPHIVALLLSEVWAMEPVKFMALVEIVALQAAGGKLTAEEIAARIGKGREAAVARQQGGVGIVPVRGVIANRAELVSNVSTGGGTSAEAIGANFQAARADDGVKAIVLDVNSPGGTVAGTEELASMIYAARGGKPIIAQVDATAASAAYWIASAADEVVVTPSGSVGSVGVVWQHEDCAKYYEQMGIENTVLTSSKYKAEGHPYGPLGDDARAHMQARVDAADARFVKALALHRGTSQAAVRETYGQGRMVDAEDAVGRGMADRIGTMQDTLQRFGASLYAPSPASSGRRASAFAREKRALSI